MYRVLIVDDESIMRMMLGTMVDWGELGFELAGCMSNGREALEYMEHERVDILITDIQMPVVDGLALIQHVKEKPDPPQILVLSAYNDFPYVRQAFKLGVYDYCLKRELGAETLTRYLEAMRQELIKAGRSTGTEQSDGQSEKLRMMALLRGQAEPEKGLLPDHYCIVRFSIGGYWEIVQKFGKDLNRDFFPVLLNLAEQISQIASHAFLIPTGDVSLTMLYRLEEGENLSPVLWVCKRLLRAWKSYVNITATAGVSRIGNDPGDFEKCLSEAEANLTMKYVMKSQNLFSPEDYKEFNREQALSCKEEYTGIIEALKQGETVRYEAEKSKILAAAAKTGVGSGKKYALHLAYHIAISLIHQIEDTEYVYENDLKQQVDKLQTEQELRIWLVNYLNDMKRYMQLHYQFEFPDEMKSAVDYLNDNYYKPDLALGEVAAHAGFSEKYFSTLFTRRMGSSCSSYLKKIRIHHAKLLLQGTHQKMKEISQSVGYNSVEYFVRVFSAETGMSPSAYRKEHRTGFGADEQ